MRDIVIAIDPGPTHSGWVIYDGERVSAGAPDTDNAKLMMTMAVAHALEGDLIRPHWAIEWITSYGMAVGAEVFETCYQVGKLCAQLPCERIPRREVKQHLCQSARAKDANIRQVLLDRHGGKDAVGRKKSPGPLYGTRSHMWAALAVACTWWDTRKPHDGG